MKYTEAQIEEIADQLMRIRIDGVPVFIALIQEVDGPYHKIYVDAGVTVARFEFEKAPEQESEAHHDA